MAVLKASFGSITKEQSDVVSCTKNVIFIQAYAGTGKTTTLYEYAKIRPKKRLLYIVFNAEARTLAQERFSDLTWVTCHTVDSLALSITGLKKDTKPNLWAYLKDTLKLENYEKSAIGRLLVKFMKTDTWLNLDSVDIEREARQMNNLGLPRDLEEREMIFEKIRKIWEDTIARKAQWHTWDLPRKVASISPQSAISLKNKYDIIMVDECQDLNKVMSCPIVKFPGQKVFVGDSNQAIYQFMNNVNLFEILHDRYKNVSGNFTLTQSFRFGPEIADYAHHILSKKNDFPDIGQPKEYVIYGNQSVKSKVITNQIEAPLGIDGLAYLTRYNASLMTIAETVCREGRSFYWNKFEKTENMVLSLLRECKNNTFKWMGLVKKAEKKMDGETGSLADDEEDESDQISIVKRILIRGVQLVEKEIQILRQNNVRNVSDADVILSTIHSAKGAEWDQVVVHADIKECINAAIRDSDFEKLDELINLYYVACTRAKFVLYDLVVPETKREKQEGFDTYDDEDTDIQVSKRQKTIC